MKIKLTLYVMAFMLAVGMASCSSGVSYSELLRDERKATNEFLAQFRIVNEIPADTIFEVGADAPYYRIDVDGNVYMQVIKNTGLDKRPKDDDRVYFRFMYFSIFDWQDDGAFTLVGNANDMQMEPTYFLYNNYDLQTSYQWGYGLQLPMQFVGVGSEVNLVVKSQYGFSEEISNVIPYHFNVRYYKSVLN